MSDQSLDPAPDGPSFAFIFDWDGVIIDSHDAHEQSWELLAHETGQPMADGFFKASFGMRNQQIIPQFFPWVDADDHDAIARLGNRKEALYRSILSRTGITPLPGVRELLSAAGEAGIPCAVGSSTPRENIEMVMELTGLRGFFRAICSAEDVIHGKPAPDVFLKAAKKLRADPSRCLVFEDAHVGLAAARAAGMRSLAVATTHPLESLHGLSTLAVQDLTEVTLDELLGLLGSGAPSA